MTSSPPPKPSMQIAIVGTALRLPGDLCDEAAFWQVLIEGRDQVTEISPERWQVDELRHPSRAEPGRSVTFSAGVLSRVEEFDAAFFGISPREAAWMDPQQRLLLELAWEAMENAGCPPSRLAGSQCAVYVGISGFDYGMRRLDDLASMSAHTMTGNTLSIAANRLSYVFDLHGPSLAVDTACSSSLVALHHACNAIAHGEASCALVGGVNLLMHPYPFIGFTKASMLSANGRCAAFDAAADGYVRGEGAVMLMLKPLEQALRDGDTIEAVIRASGVNADGARKSGLTIPSTQGQVELMRTVLGRSGLEAGDLDYLEAHGTGTAIGDPIEVAAIGAVYGAARSAGQPLPIGSVKTNLGHLEPASGLAGLMKALLVLKHGVVPPAVHLTAPNPRIDFAGLQLDPVDRVRDIARFGADVRPLRAGVNSFGFGGANAHVLLEAAPPAPLETQYPPGTPLPAVPLALSAMTREALAALAARYAVCVRALGEDRAALYDLQHAAAHDRDWLPWRLLVAPLAPVPLADALDGYAEGRSHPAVFEQQALPEPGTVGFVYSGNGAQWLGMGRALLAESAAFRRHIEHLDGLIADHAAFSVLAELQVTDAAHARLHDTAIAQPLLFAIQVAVTELLQEQGVVPAAVAGHSVGEVAAAWACGALDLEQAIHVICARSAAQALTAGAGRMAVVVCPAGDMTVLLTQIGAGDVTIAAFNAPEALTLSGPLDQLQRVQAHCKAQGRLFKLLDLDYAFHSAAMDPVRERLLASLDGLEPQAGMRVPMVSTVSGGLLMPEDLGPDYWWDNIRQPVRFQQAIERMIALGCRVFVEIGPHAILQSYMNQTAAAAGSRVRVLASLKAKDDGPDRLVDVAMQVHGQLGLASCGSLFTRPARRLRLPNYPWQRERHVAPGTPEGSRLLARRRRHPLLGWRLPDAEAGWENVLDLRTQPWLKDHSVVGAAVLAGAAYVEIALAAAFEWTGEVRCRIENLDILAPLAFDTEHGRTLRFDLQPRDLGFQIRSRPRLSEDLWTLHAVGRLGGQPARRSATRRPVARTVAHTTIDRATHYRLAELLGLEYGPCFRAFERGEIDGDCLYGELRSEDDRANVGTLLPPGLLDACFQSPLGFFRAEIEAGHGLPLLPVRIGELQFHRDAAVTGFRTQLVRASAHSVEADFELTDARGELVASLQGCRFRAATLRQDHLELPACWEHRLRLTPLPSTQRTVSWPSTQRLSETLRSWQTEHESRLRRAEFHGEALPLFDALVVSALHHAVRRYADEDPTGAELLIDGVPGGSPALQPFRSWLVQLLRQQDLLLDRGEGTVLAESDLPPVDEIWRTLLRDYPSSLQELVLIGRVIAGLPDLLAGRAEATALAGELAASQQFESLYEDSFAYAGSHQALAQLLTGLAAQRAPERRLRVLELTPGVGTLAGGLAAGPDADALDYVVAHENAAVCARIADDYRALGFLSVAQLESSGQGFAAGAQTPERFDVVVLRHSLNRFAAPGAVLSWLRSRLAAGGLLLVAERHPDLAVDLRCGLDERWWRSAGQGGARSRLESRQSWERLLGEQGYSEVRACLELGGEEELGGSYLLLAKSATTREQPGAETAARDPARWLLLCAGADNHALGGRLSELLVSRGQQVELADLDGRSGSTPPDDAQRIAAILSAAGHRLGTLDHVVDLSALKPGNGTPDLDSVIAASHCGRALHLVKALRALNGHAPRLWWIASGALPLEGAAGPSQRRPALAALWGLGRVLGNEWPELRTTLIDAGGVTKAAQLAPLLALELLEPDDEREIWLSERGRYGVRLQRAALTRSSAPESADGGYRLQFQVPGQLRNLAWHAFAEAPLGDDQIEVQTVAAGLNFRDVMYTMGLLPDEAVENGFSGASLGLEFSGVVTRIGRRVESAAVGDEVLGFGPACFANRVVTSASAVTHKPSDWTFESAATVPTAFFTAYYALRHLANLQPGERVLIHGAAGGVGIAAIEVARHLKAEIFATAGTAERRDFVRLLGADRVFDSRSTDFAQEILDATGGEGVDVILNSLAGEAVRRNLQILKPFGRFLELGKRDFFENTPIGLRPFKDNISYFGIDADQLLMARPALATRLFREVMALFREGVLSPLPYTAFTADQVVEAFRYMQQARQIGKVVVSMAEAPRQIDRRAKPAAPVHFRKDRSYLVTGGLEGFGLETARWLASEGAGTVVLVGRRGAATPGAEQAAADLKALGARVEIAACDVTEKAALEALLRRIARELPPLAGIVHAAMQIDDGLIDGLDEARLRTVLGPKLVGAWNLHALSIDLPLEHFILYSSVTTAIGNPGQANYVAANAALEGLACLRRGMGLPVCCVGWGPIGDAGYLTRNTAVRDLLAQRTGALPLESAQSLQMLGSMLAAQQTTQHIANLDWGAMAARLPALKLPRLSALAVTAAGERRLPEGAAAFQAMIADKSWEEVAALVREYVTYEVSQILGIGAGRIDAERSLHDLGMDSLMGVELAAGLEKRFGIQLPAMLLNEGPSIERVCERILEQISAGAASSDAEQEGRSDADLAALVTQLAVQHGEQVTEAEVQATVADVKRAG